jgi:hypothetical protein
VPHQRWEPGDHGSFDNSTSYQLASAKAQVFALDGWGETFHDDFRSLPGEIVIHEHLESSGLANTDLDPQLKQHGIRRIVLINMVANTLRLGRAPASIAGEAGDPARVASAAGREGSAGTSGGVPPADTRHLRAVQ